MIEDDALVTALKEEWNAAKAQREQAERRIAELEGIERDLRAESDAVERLRVVWKDWSGALDADPVLARQLLRKVVDGPIVVHPVRKGVWTYKGRSRFDGLLVGHVTPKGSHSFPTATGSTNPSNPYYGRSAWDGPVWRPASAPLVPIAGGSDAESLDDRTPEMAPQTPQRSSRPE